jgi:hypothetical protein
MKNYTHKSQFLLNIECLISNKKSIGPLFNITSIETYNKNMVPERDCTCDSIKKNKNRIQYVENNNEVKYLNRVILNKQHLQKFEH